MNRVAVFAHFDKNQKIEDYVIYYLKELKKVVKNIIFVSDSDVLEDEQAKIKDLVDFSCIKKHGEYDFGSYKRGFFIAKEKGLLDNCDELLFVNDSCYAPLYPFEEMFNKMSSQDLDFWGATLNKEYHLHIQSFFIVFKPQVFKSTIFENFMHSIKKEHRKIDIVKKYEIGLSKCLLENKYKMDVYSKISNLYNAVHVTKYKKLILQDKLPLIKRNIILNKEIRQVCPFRIKELIKQTDYNYNLIQKDCISNMVYVPLHLKLLYIFNRFRRKIIRISFKERKVQLFGKTYQLN